MNPLLAQVRAAMRANSPDSSQIDKLLATLSQAELALIVVTLLDDRTGDSNDGR